MLIAGAGSNLVSGMDLGDGDRAEHLPYVREGMAVLAYELDGMIADLQAAGDRQILDGCVAFLGAQAGLINAHNAIEYATKHVPSIDPDRLYAIGHSSAATLALLVAENEPRIAACVAFAAPVSMRDHLPQEFIDALARTIPAARQFYTRFDPRSNESRIRCPLFLFYADDDTRFARHDREFGDRLRAAGKEITVENVPAGGHYVPMIRVGVPHAIEWLKALPARGAQPAAG